MLAALALWPTAKRKPAKDDKPEKDDKGSGGQNVTHVHVHAGERRARVRQDEPAKGKDAPTPTAKGANDAPDETPANGKDDVAGDPPPEGAK
jgi:hypothetical protein